MAAYLLKRLLLIIPTLFGIMLISFAIIQFAPGGPVERVIAQLHRHRRLGDRSRIGGGQGDGLGSGGQQQIGAGQRATPARSIAARRASTPSSSSSSRSSSASTSRRTSASS